MIYMVIFNRCRAFLERRKANTNKTVTVYIEQEDNTDG